MNKFKKVIAVVFRNLIKPMQYISPNTYMQIYSWYLKKLGLHLTGSPRYIHPSVSLDGTGYDKTYLGDDIVISKNVVFLNHDYSLGCGLRALGEHHDTTPYF